MRVRICVGCGKVFKTYGWFAVMKRYACWRCSAAVSVRLRPTGPTHITGAVMRGEVTRWGNGNRCPTLEQIERHMGDK